MLSSVPVTNLLMSTSRKKARSSSVTGIRVPDNASSISGVPHSISRVRISFAALRVKVVITICSGETDQQERAVGLEEPEPSFSPSLALRRSAVDLRDRGPDRHAAPYSAGEPPPEPARRVGGIGRPSRVHIRYGTRIDSFLYRFSLCPISASAHGRGLLALLRTVLRFITNSNFVGCSTARDHRLRVRKTVFPPSH